MQLKHSLVYRGGLTSDKITQELQEIRCNPSSLPYLDYGFGYRLSEKMGGEPLCISTYLASKGGGTTNVKLFIGAKDFQSVLRMMAETNPDVTLDAINRELPNVVKDLRDRYKATTMELKDDVNRLQADKDSVRDLKFERGRSPVPNKYPDNYSHAYGTWASGKWTIGEEMDLQASRRQKRREAAARRRAAKKKASNKESAQ